MSGTRRSSGVNFGALRKRVGWLVGTIFVSTVELRASPPGVAAMAENVDSGACGSAP